MSILIYCLVPGHHLYTIGQRARLGGHSQPYCVTCKDPHTNTVTVVEGTSHPALYTLSFITLRPHWITCKSRDLVGQSDGIECLMRHRHQHSLVPCTVNLRSVCLCVHVITCTNKLRVFSTLILCIATEDMVFLLL